MNKKIVLSILFSVAIVSVSAQVTIGSDVMPIEGALLDIKQQVANTSTNVTATKGVIFPRVQLSAKGSLSPLAADNVTNHRTHIGTVVYNLKAVEGSGSVAALQIGLNVWDGSQWQSYKKQRSVLLPNFFYLPQFELPLGTLSGATKTFNLYDEYKRQFSPNPTNPKFFSSGGNTVQIPGVYSVNDLIYAVLHYDSSIISVTQIDTDGTLHYTVNNTAPTTLSYITVVCIVKD